jgi:hypothetical protein
MQFSPTSWYFISLRSKQAYPLVILTTKKVVAYIIVAAIREKQKRSTSHILLSIHTYKEGM